MEQAHWLPLANEKVRAAFRDALRQHGRLDASYRENDLILRLGDPSSDEVRLALRLAGFYPEVRKDFLRCASAHEHLAFYCMNPSPYLAQLGGFIRVPSFLCRLRAQGYLKAGQRQLALQEIAQCRAILPGDPALPIALLPLLERQGLKKEAAALYDEAHALHEKLCREYPKSAWLHNATAWMSACCRRDLDQGLEHALKSVKLAPAASNLDTLAEIYFQRGDRARALAAQKRAVELDPKRDYYRKQLKRFEAGDPRAERPPEIEE